jgi:hypothetical protein
MDAEARAQTASATLEGNMKPGAHLAAALAMIAALSSNGASAAPGTSSDLELRRVLLSSGGVGYFEYEATLQGESDLHLSVRRDQVDDVLKSLVISDDTGNLGQVSLPGKDLTSEALRDNPISEAALDSPAALLEALRGADVQVESGGRVLVGRIISITEEQARKTATETVTQHRLALLSEGALHQIVVEDMESLKVLDPALQQQLGAALDALSRQRERDRRELTIHLAGAGERVVRVGYVAEVPLWKSTYRLVLPPMNVDESASLTAFAVVENRSGEDWKDVDLTLVSGDPVTFRQAIYDTYYVNRPTVPVEVIGRVLPKRDEGGVGTAAEPAPTDAPAFDLMEPPTASLHSGFMPGGGFQFGAPKRRIEAPRVAEITPAESTEQATQVVFDLPSPVTLASGDTALLPMLTLSLPAKRVSLYQPGADARHPLSSIEIKNSGATDLPPGVLAIYERAAEGSALTYAGDAQLALLPSGEKRFVSYAVDLRVTIDRAESIDQIISKATLSQGTLILTRTERNRTIYTVAGAAHEPRTVILEHPRIAGYDLVASSDFTLLETTADSYRLQLDVPADKTVKVTVILEKPVIEVVALATTSTDDLVTYAASAEVPDAIRTALGKVIERRADVAVREAALKQKNADRTKILDDQARLRDNLKAVPAGGDLAKKYLKRLDDQETRLSALDDEITAAEVALGVARAALTAEIKALGT